MSHGFLILPVAVIPEWTKQNVPTYPLGSFSNDGAEMLIDDAHPISTYQKWLGPNFHLLDSIMAASVKVTGDELKAMRADPQSAWYAAPEVD